MNRYVQCRGVEVDALDDCEDDMGDKVSNAAVVTQCMELAMTMIESTVQELYSTETEEFGIYR